MSDPQRPEREAIEQALAKVNAMRDELNAQFQDRRLPVIGPDDQLFRALDALSSARFALLAALPPTPTPGSVKELREWLLDEAEFAHQKGWNDRAETLIDVEAKCDDLKLLAAPTVAQAPQAVWKVDSDGVSSCSLHEALTQTDAGWYCAKCCDRDRAMFINPSGQVNIPQTAQVDDWEAPPAPPAQVLTPEELNDTALLVARGKVTGHLNKITFSHEALRAEVARLQEELTHVQTPAVAP